MVRPITRQAQQESAIVLSFSGVSLGFAPGLRGGQATRGWHGVAVFPLPALRSCHYRRNTDKCSSLSTAS